MRSPVARARKISPLPWLAVLPVRASPRPARRASRWQAAQSSGPSVTMTTMHDPATGGRGVPREGSGSSRPAGIPATVSRSRSPKLVRVTTPTVAPPGRTRDAVPMPPLYPRQLIPVPAPTAPSPAAPSPAAPSPAAPSPAAPSPAAVPPADARAAASARATSSGETCMRRASLRKLSSHSATMGMITSSVPIAGCSAMSSSQAAS